LQVQKLRCRLVTTTTAVSKRRRRTAGNIVVIIGSGGGGGVVVVIIVAVDVNIAVVVVFVVVVFVVVVGAVVGIVVPTVDAAERRCIFARRSRVRVSSGVVYNRHCAVATACQRSLWMGRARVCSAAAVVVGGGDTVRGSTASARVALRCGRFKRARFCV
jgi:hypothetical protein